MKQATLKTMKVADIAPSSYNPRETLKPGQREYDALKTSIAEFGMVEPLVWNERTKRLVGGHQRLSVLRAMGADETTVAVVSLGDAEEKALNVALNKIKGEWDFDRLAEMLCEFDADEATVTGFTAADIAIVCERICEDFSDGDSGAPSSDDSDVDEDGEPESDYSDAAENGINRRYVITVQFPAKPYAMEYMSKNGIGFDARQVDRVSSKVVHFGQL